MILKKAIASLLLVIKKTRSILFCGRVLKKMSLLIRAGHLRGVRVDLDGISNAPLCHVTCLEIILIFMVEVLIYSSRIMKMRLRKVKDFIVTLIKKDKVKIQSL